MQIHVVLVVANNNVDCYHCDVATTHLEFQSSVFQRLSDAFAAAVTAVAAVVVLIFMLLLLLLRLYFKHMVKPHTILGIFIVVVLSFILFFFLPMMMMIIIIIACWSPTLVNNNTTMLVRFKSHTANKPFNLNVQFAQRLGKCEFVQIGR